MLPDKTTNNSANIGVKPNRAAVIWSDEVSLSAYLENAVEVPQQAAAPAASKAAISVPLPVERLTLRPGKETTYAPIRATAAKLKNFLVNGSWSNKPAVIIANIGFNSCRSTTTEKGMY